MGLSRDPIAPPSLHSPGLSITTLATTLSAVKTNLSLSPLSSLMACASAMLRLDLWGESPLGPYLYQP